MKFFPLPLLLLWLIPIVVTKATFCRVSISPEWTRNYRTLTRSFLNHDAAPCTFEVAPNGFITALATFGVNRGTKQN